MKRWVFYILMIQIVAGTMGMIGQHPNLFPAVFSSQNAYAQETSDAGISEAPNYFLRFSIALIGFVLIWLLFYYLMYPELLKYYEPDYCKTLFWSILLLYYLGWLTINAYVVFEFGYYFFWGKWIFVFIGAMWLVWVLIVLLKKDRAY